jgi:large subunit ribosomal protein L2
MGKQLRVQRRGRGGYAFRVPSYDFNPRLAYKCIDGTIADIVHDRLKSAPIAKIKYEDGSTGYITATEGMMVGRKIAGIVKQLKDFEEGDTISSIESYPNSGPKICRTPGSSAMIVSKTKNECVVQLPSKKLMSFNLAAMAMAGIPAGDGRKDKPLLKAGRKYHITHVRGKVWPRTAGVAMSAVSHPYGGSGTGHKRRPVGHNAPPGQKIGTLWPRRTGKKKGKIEAATTVGNR